MTGEASGFASPRESVMKKRTGSGSTIPALVLFPFGIGAFFFLRWRVIAHILAQISKEGPGSPGEGEKKQ
jgi:hypothetical protein